MNLVVLKGNLVRDPEVREINSGSRKTKVANFTIAVSRYFTKGNGERDKETVFLPCEAWDTGAERIELILRKGDPVLVEGTLKEERWEKDGVKHNRLKIRVGTFDKLNRSPNSKTEGGEEATTATAEEVAAATTDPSPTGNSVEEIPF